MTERAALTPETRTRPTVLENEEMAQRWGYIVGLPPSVDLGTPRRLDLQAAREVNVTTAWAKANDFEPAGLVRIASHRTKKVWYRPTPAP